MLAADTIAGLSTDVFFDMLAVRIDPAKAAGQALAVNWHFTDRQEKLAMTVKHCTLTHRLGDWSDKASATVITSRTTLDAIVIGRAKIPEVLASGALKIEGDASRLAVLFAMFDGPSGLMFDVLTPGEGRV
jgi:alkyl sulfatase BDS1-like metallo-beta-lactamase superfamily hydrolase